MLFMVFASCGFSGEITPNGMHQGDLATLLWELKDRSQTAAAMNTGVLAKGTNTAEVKITAAINYIANGVFGQIATFDDPLVPENVRAQATGTTRYYSVSYDPTNSTTEVWMGDDSTAASAHALVPEGNIIFGLIGVANTSGSDFTMGTTSYDAAGIAETFRSLNGRPITITVKKSD